MRAAILPLRPSASDLSHFMAGWPQGFHCFARAAPPLQLHCIATAPPLLRPSALHWHCPCTALALPLNVLCCHCTALRLQPGRRVRALALSRGVPFHWRSAVCPNRLRPQVGAKDNALNTPLHLLCGRATGAEGVAPSEAVGSGAPQGNTQYSQISDFCLESTHASVSNFNPHALLARIRKFKFC